MKNLINKSEVQTYKNIKDFINNNNLSITKLYIYNELANFIEFEQLNEQQQSKILNSIYSYWLYSYLTENYIYNIVEIAIHNLKTIIQNNFDYKFFENLLNENI